MSDAVEPGLAVQDIAYAGLDALRATMPLDLCAYLHVGPTLGPQLYLRAPTLSSLDSTAAFELFNALRDVLATAEPGRQVLAVGAFNSLAVLTAGGVSRGLFVVGRREDSLSEHEQDLIAGLCHAVGVAVHTVDAAGRPAVDHRPLKLAVEVTEGVAHAEVVVPVAGELCRGTGEGLAPSDAVARATIDALRGSGLKLESITDGDVGGERVVIALLRDDADQPGVGAALIRGDALQAAAVATLDAAAKLRR